MKELKTKIEIEATSEKVWSILTDFEKYPEWNPFIKRASGNVNVKNMREFAQVVNKKRADLGVFVCFGEQVTRPMKHEAKSEGYYDPETGHFKDKIDKIQIVTVEDLLDGRGINFPVELYRPESFKAATKKLDAEHEQIDMDMQ